MPDLKTCKLSNASFAPSYIPVAIFVGGTSGVGQGMVEAFARYTGGHAHIIVIGRNEHTAGDIIPRFPKPDVTEGAGWSHEFVACDVSLMSNVRAACAAIAAKVQRVNFLVMTASYSSFVHPGLTSEGLDLHLAMRYYYRFVFIHSLLPLLNAAQQLGQPAHAMSVLGAGNGRPARPIDLTNLGNVVTPRDGRLKVSMRGNIMSSDYTDAMMGHFASQNPTLAFTHIHPGIVRTTFRADFDGFLTPLGWLLNLIIPLVAVSQDVCAEYMLHALFTADRGVFLRNRYADIVSAREFEEVTEFGDSDEMCVLAGTPMRGYGASDRAVRAVVAYSEAVTAPRSSSA